MCGDMWRGRGDVVTYGCGDELVRGVCVGVVLGESRDGERHCGVLDAVMRREAV
jgi:hypothetical protein